MSKRGDYLERAAIERGLWCTLEGFEPLDGKGPGLLPHVVSEALIEAGFTPDLNRALIELSRELDPDA